MKYAITCLILLLCSCSRSGDTISIDGFTYSKRIVIIDSCEYVVVGLGQSQMMSHKGNCKNHKK